MHRGKFNDCICFVSSVQALVTLHGGETYRFIHVEDFGYVSSYNPRVSAGDVQIMVEVCQLLSINDFYIEIKGLQGSLQFHPLANLINVILNKKSYTVYNCVWDI